MDLKVDKDVLTERTRGRQAKAAESVGTNQHASWGLALSVDASSGARGKKKGQALFTPALEKWRQSSVDDELEGEGVAVMEVSVESLAVMVPV